MKNSTPSSLENNKLDLKICGMKLNTNQVAALQPDYLGFIFWENSKRNFTGRIEELPDSIKKVGVFVNATIEEIKKKVSTYNLQAVQLHGKESVAFCKALKEELTALEIIKVFSIKDEFDFGVLNPFETVADYFLFDTKGKLPGGNGYTFNWDVLKNYPSTKPFFLSGGIGLEEIEQLTSFLKTPASKYCKAIDVNSKFETEPGLKNIEKLKELISVLKNETKSID
jgi:phosphoribosylanthranilate isomerase